MTNASIERLAYGKRRALNEMHSIFGCQWSNGMLPQIRFLAGPGGEEGNYRPGPSDWGVSPQVTGPTRLRTSGITQPPIIGMCAYDIFLKFSEAERKAHLDSFLTFSRGLQRFHNWLLSERDHWGENLVLCLHPWETGTDNSPAFDPLIETTHRYIEESALPVHLFGGADNTHVPAEHRPTNRDYFAYFGLLALFKKHDYQQRAIIEESPFLLQDILFNSLLAASLRAHSQLQTQLADMVAEAAGHEQHVSRGQLQAEADNALEMYERVASAVRRKLWDADAGFFHSYDSRDNRLLQTPTVSGFVPLLSSIASDEQATGLIERLIDPSQFWTQVPVPSTSANSPAFDPVRYWSGPSWPVTNWLVIRGLQERQNVGGAALAETLRQSTLRMITEGIDSNKVRLAAIRLMEANSVGEDFTTPSQQQYQHGWLWDSAIVAASWPLVSDRPSKRRDDEGRATEPGFWEYYHPATGDPLGAPHMTWTASLYLELLEMNDNH
ncbi:MAG: trehalase family glycosidase [Chloroflexia bacterium]